MRNVHPAVAELAHPPVHATSETPVPAAGSGIELSAAELLGIQYVQSFPFAPGARVAGYLTQADIGPTSFGFLHGTGLPADENFVTFETIGIDVRGGYEIVRSAAGVAYVIVTYASHARECGLDILKRHIGAHPDYYAVRSLILDPPWCHSQEMVEQLEAAWKHRWSQHVAQKRIETLYKALKQLKQA